MLQRKCACGGGQGLTGECEECGKKKLQRRAVGCSDRSEIPPIVDEVLRSSGQPLDSGARSLVESRFGFNFSRVRVHTDGKAAESARAVDALAYTVGADIVVGAGMYDPGSERGLRLLAHELAHVVQQSSAQHAPHNLSIGSPDDDAEKAAEATAARVVALQQAQPTMAGAVSERTRRSYFAQGEEARSADPVPGLAGPGTVSRQALQRAKIAYKALTWADFKGTPPAGATLSALTKSGFDVPAWKTKETAEDTKTACTGGKKAVTEFKATLSIDPAAFDSGTAYMNQDQSWVKPRYKDGGKAYCAGKATECDAHFKTAASEAKTQCSAEVNSCTDAFAAGSTKYTLPVGKTTITITSAADCSTTLPKSCQAALVADAKFDLTSESGTKITTAVKKEDCTAGLQNDCLTFEKAEGPRLLKHEQGHFDISKTLADKARASLQGKTGTFAATETKCGKAEAVKAAREAFGKLGAVDALQKLGQSWIDAKNTAESDYDTQTDHGKKAKEQTTWGTKIAAGLKEYDPTKPPPSAPGATTGPATTPVAPPSPGP